MSEYAAFYGTIGYQLTQVAEGQKQHSYAMVPESIYRGWKRLISFKDEKEASYFGTDMAEHQTTIAHFEDEGHNWYVTTAKCAHPSDPADFCWRYISSKSPWILSHYPVLKSDSKITSTAFLVLNNQSIPRRLGGFLMKTAGTKAGGRILRLLRFAASYE